MPQRQSTIVTSQDAAGTYETEIFECDSKPRGVIVCAHGNGVRRWDGEAFFYQVADHYTDYIVVLVDQNQPYKDGCELPSLDIMVNRVQEAVVLAHQAYRRQPLYLMAHSMGCGIVTYLDLSDVNKVVFVAPTAGDQQAKLQKRYGAEIMEGMTVKTTDGLTKKITKEFVDSCAGVVWEERYRELLQRYPEVYVFESGDEEIVGDERLAHRDLPFAGYEIIPGATHNFSGEPLKRLFDRTDPLL